MTDRYVVFKILSERSRRNIRDWAQDNKNNGQPALFQFVKDILTVVCQESVGYTNGLYQVDWFVECCGLTSLFLNIYDWGLSESTDTMLFGRYNLDKTLEFLGALDSLPEYQQWKVEHFNADSQQLGTKSKSEREEKKTPDYSAIMAENTQLKLENEKLKQDLDRVKEECWRYKRFHDAGL